MGSLFLAIALLAGAEPSAPVAPEPPRVEAPAAPAVTGPHFQPSKASQGAAPAAAPAPTAEPVPAPAPAPGPGPKPGPGPGPRHPAPKAAAHDAVPPASGDPTVVPPSLSAGALRDELHNAARRRQEELAALARERERLEKLAAEIAAARGALAAETARLEEKLKQVEAARTAAPPPAAAPARVEAKRPGDASPKIPSGEALAKTLKGMKADQAAALVSRLERRLAVDLLRHMRPADAGTVLEKMKPETAAELFSLMASREAPGASR